ncbi:MAG: putative 2OG-Fe(II) oxygenase [Pseudomonadota bacterium]
MDGIVGIFPTPLFIGRKLVPKPLLARLIEQFEASETGANVRTGLLTHTPTASPQTHENYKSVLSLVSPAVQTYGEALLGERLAWGIKEIWINRMEQGGAQKLHNHANSFISGILYITDTHPASATVFYRNVGAQSFVMSNENKRCKMTAFNSPVFQVPDVGAGDLVLFPSYMMHEVPPNQGEPRLTAAFNALPERLDSWGYQVQFR